jgi:hypothetical protein
MELLRQNRVHRQSNAVGHQANRTHAANAKALIEGRISGAFAQAPQKRADRQGPLPVTHVEPMMIASI